MQLRITALTIFLAASKNAVSGCRIEEDVPLTPCYDYSDLLIDLDDRGCTSSNIVRQFKDVYTVKKDESGCNCRGGSKREIRALTGNDDYDAALQTLVDMCSTALADAAHSNDVPQDWEIDGIDLEDYFDGKGILNTETGNFQQTTTKFMDGGGYNSYISISENPRLNDHYATTEESYQAGVQVKDLYDNRAMTEYFNAPAQHLETCVSNTVMCCWGRDRQYFDGNGSCKVKDCANENPGDNTDLCWTEQDGTVFPYPGDSTEQDLHCHGISWGTEETSGADVNNMGKWNNLFYVSLYDHMYERGYVESITDDEQIAGEHPMCGCIESMPPVARADCQEVVGKSDYTVTVVDNSFVIEPVDDSFRMEFESCQGYKYDESLAPEDYETELNLGELTATDNDLAGFVFKLWLQGKLSDEQVGVVEGTLIGYRRSDLNLGNDNQRRDACEDAFNERFPTLDYEERDQTISDVDSFAV